MIDHTILKPDAKKMRSKLFVKRQKSLAFMQFV